MEILREQVGRLREMAEVTEVTQVLTPVAAGIIMQVVVAQVAMLVMVEKVAGRQHQAGTQQRVLAAAVAVHIEFATAVAAEVLAVVVVLGC